MNKLEHYLEYLISWLQEKVHAANAQGVIVGISGGIDSAVAVLIAKKAFPQTHLGVMMPCNSLPIDLQYSKKLVEQYNINNLTIELTKIYEIFVNILPFAQTNNSLVKANIKPRLRMTTLYALAQDKNYLVLGTDNADEWYTGYFTKYGDGAADLVPLIHLLKKEVYILADMLGVPQEIINRPPTAALWENQTDEDELGIRYNDLDSYLLGTAIDDKLTKQVELLHQRSEHKRNLPQKPKKISEII